MRNDRFTDIHRRASRGEQVTDFERICIHLGARMVTHERSIKTIDDYRTNFLLAKAKVAGIDFENDDWVQRLEDLNALKEVEKLTAKLWRTPEQGIAAQNALFDWIITSDFKLQSSPTPRARHLYNFLEAWKGPWDFSRDRPHSFLVKHDWAAAFKGDREFDDKASSCRPPMPKCCFEFGISGRTILVLSAENNDGTLKIYNAYISMPPYSNWWDTALNADPRKRSMDNRPAGYEHADGEFIKCPEELYEGLERLNNFISRSVKAVCVALEAEVAETEVVRNFYKANFLKDSKTPSSPDYHIVNLANRKRYAPVPEELRDGKQRTGPRLHLRRGHLRHYANYNIWIKWQLVGNPDLGFIDKDYRL